MLMMPFQILGIWLRGLIALALLGLGIYLVREFYETKRPTAIRQPVASANRADIAEDGRTPAVREVIVRRPGWQLGLDRENAYLIGGIALIFASLGGGMMGSRLIAGARGLSAKAPDSDFAAQNGTTHRITRPDGAELHTVTLGPEDAPILVLTHGWGCDHTEWKYSIAKLAEHHRVIAWDLPGCGQSTHHPDNDFSLEVMARDLDAVIDLAGGRPVVLVGHSIGGMIGLTYCRLFPEKIGPRVAGLALVHTTFTNPVETTEWSGLYKALQKPLLEPLCYLMIGLAPLVWVMNWMSYLNGSAHRSTHRSSFSGQEPWDKLDFASRFITKIWPANLARGMLAMFRYDAKPILGTIGVPCVVIAGEADSTTKPWASALMAESIPQAELKEMPRLKHQGHMEREDEFVGLIADYVRNHAEVGANLVGR